MAEQRWELRQHHDSRHWFIDEIVAGEGLTVLDGLDAKGAAFVYDALLDRDDLLRACEKAFARFNEQNGEVSQEVWNANYQVHRALREAIRKAKGE